MVCSQLQSETLFVGNHILVLSGVPLPACAKSIWLQNLSKKRLGEGMNASSTQRYIFTSLDAGSNIKRAWYSIHKVNFRKCILRLPSVHKRCLVAKRLKCIKVIPPGQLQHEGSHDHSLDPDVVHYCQARSADSDHASLLTDARTDVRVANITVHFCWVRFETPSQISEGLPLCSKRSFTART